MGVSPISEGLDPPFFIIFTDLDGTLLDHTTYGWKEAVPALDICRRRGVPVVFASSKTRAEMDVLRRRMSLSDPFISENGGGVFFPRETFSAPPRRPLRPPRKNAKRLSGIMAFGNGPWACLTLI
jgi:HAD superfamily hydrolase (TIGR01484 family)